MWRQEGTEYTRVSARRRRRWSDMDGLRVARHFGDAGKHEKYRPSVFVARNGGRRARSACGWCLSCWKLFLYTRAETSCVDAPTYRRYAREIFFENWRANFFVCWRATKFFPRKKHVATNQRVVLSTQPCASQEDETWGNFCGE